MSETTKQPYESYEIYADFEKNMGIGETISSHDISVVDVSGVDATATIIETDSEIIGTGYDFAKIYVRIKGGTEAGSPYKITFKVVTSADDKFEKDGNIIIDDE